MTPIHHAFRPDGVPQTAGVGNLCDPDLAFSTVVSRVGRSHAGRTQTARERHNCGSCDNPWAAD